LVTVRLGSLGGAGGSACQVERSVAATPGNAASGPQIETILSLTPAGDTVSMEMSFAGGAYTMSVTAEKKRVWLLWNDTPSVGI
jgi:hypothetical protein